MCMCVCASVCACMHACVLTCVRVCARVQILDEAIGWLAISNTWFLTLFNPHSVAPADGCRLNQPFSTPLILLIKTPHVAISLSFIIQMW